MAKLILANTGETIWDRERKWAGTRDIPLTDRGRTQAVQAGLVLFEGDVQVDAAYTSVLQRTIETAKLMLQMLEYQPLTIPTIALDERNYGIYTGQSEKDIQKAVGKKHLIS